MINYQFFPKSLMIPSHLELVIEVFENAETLINSDNQTLKSNEVLSVLTTGLENLGYEIEKGKKAFQKIKVPVLFGLNGQLDKYFEADGLNIETRTVLEVEAGRAVTKNQFLKDLFQACMMSEIEFLIIAVRNYYGKNPDFQAVNKFFDTLYTSGRLQLPLKGVLIIGY